jgi:predicted dehydrogenase
MDGVMFMHNPRLLEMRKKLDDSKKFGPIKRVTSSFSFFGGSNFGSNVRMNSSAEPTGCIGDVGWYCIRISLWAFQYQLPSEVTAVAHKSTADGVPTSVSATLHFPNDQTASFHCSFDLFQRMWAEVAGERGNMWIPWFSTIMDKKAPEIYEYTTTTADDGANTFKNDMTDKGQHVKMFEKFAELVKARKSGSVHEEFEFFPRLAYITQCVNDACFASVKADGKPTKVKYGVHAL